MSSKTEVIETIDVAHKRLICKALNKCGGSMGKAYPLLAPEGSPTIRSIYNLMNRLGIERDLKGIYN